MPNAAVERNDRIVESYLERQNLDPESLWRGALPDADGLHQPGSAGGLLNRGTASLLHPESRLHRNPTLRRRLKMAVDHLARVQTPDGNFDLLTTNFNSPPDTAFIMRNTVPAARLARMRGDAELFGRLEPVLRKAGDGLVRGGVHTPNHRWVVCAALAQLHELFHKPAYVGRIDQWLAEGIDIDEDGQFSEQSTTVYNAVTDDALIVAAHKLGRPKLLEPVRRNLETMLYLLHPGFEVVTEISRRQDRDTIADMGRYWFPLKYMARKTGDGRFETVARAFEPARLSLPDLLEYPELEEEGPAPRAVPDDYERFFEKSRLARFRRGRISASLLLDGGARFFAVRNGEAVVDGVRFASAFFGKGQFKPDAGRRIEGGYRLEQTLEAPYVQPFEDGRKQPWGVESWYRLRPERRQTEINRMRYALEAREVEGGFDLELTAAGVDHVPLAVEISLRPGGELRGARPVAGREDVFLLDSAEAVYRRGGDEIRFGPGVARTRYTEVRGAEPKLPGPSVYLTDYTPFRRTLRFRW